MATTDLTGKVASASALKNIVTKGNFKANLSQGNNKIKSLGAPTDIVTSGTLPSSNLCIINTGYISANNSFDWSYHFDSSGSALYIYTNVSQSISFDWVQFNI